MGAVAGLWAVAALPFVAMPTSTVWLVLLLSVLLHNGYKLCLAGAYARGDFGQAFPLARGMVPLFATLIALVALGQVPSLGQCLGLVLVSAGLLLLAVDKLNGWGALALLLAAAAAGAAVAAYSTLDAYGTRLHGDWFGFTAWLVALDSLTFLVLGRALRGPGLWAELHAARGRVLVSGLLDCCRSCVFLWALSRHPVGVVTSVRETSVLFAMAIGIALHREPLSQRRILGAILIFAAIVVIAT